MSAWNVLPNSIWLKYWHLAVLWVSTVGGFYMSGSHATGIAYLNDVFVFQGFFRFRTDLSTDISMVIKEFNEI